MVLLFAFQFAWVLYCDLVCLDYDGNLYDACSIALTAALKNGKSQIDGFVQERRNSIANAMELRLSCTNPLRCNMAAEPCFNIKTIFPGMDSYVKDKPVMRPSYL